MSRYELYGDGIHDDTRAIQEMIDSGVCQVTLPAPKKCYFISSPLVIPSNFKLKLPRYAEIKLKDGSNCFMLVNKTVSKPQKRQREFLSQSHREMWRFYDLLSPDPEDACHDFEIEGGVWNYNNKNQEENPFYTRNFDERNYLGQAMFFYNVRGFKISNLTVKDPINYAITMDTASYFTVENITFDFNFGNPIASNMDGVHLNGNCHFGVIRDLKGACYDDMVALNAHEGSGGDITNIQIDGLFADNCHSAVRLLTVNHKIEHIDIRNVYGTYYQYCIGFTKYYPGETTGGFDAVTLKDIHASKSKRLPIQEVHMRKNKDYHFPFIWIQEDTVVGELTIDGLWRRERINPVDTIHVGKGAVVERMTVRSVSVKNETDLTCLPFVNNGRIGTLITDSFTASDLKVGESGSIDKIITMEK